MLFSVLSLALGLVAASPLDLTHLNPRQQVCNGNAAFCDRKFTNVTLIGTHNAPFVGPILDPRVNQEKNVTEQLDAGIRYLQGQTHLPSPNSTEIDMCHTSCLELNAGSLKDYLTTIKTWLDANPNDVVTMLLVNGDNLDMTLFDAVYQTVGLADYAFVPSTSPAKLAFDAWPTYGELISSGKRLVVFIDSGANEKEVPYILDEFKYYFETPFDQTDPDFKECSIDRPAGASPDGRMYLVNHDLDTDLLGIFIPDDAADFRTNAATGNGSIGAQADLCISLYGRNPNVILVDMFDRGDVFTAQNTLNGV